MADELDIGDETEDREEDNCVQHNACEQWDEGRGSNAVMAKLITIVARGRRSTPP